MANLLQNRVDKMNAEHCDKGSQFLQDYLRFAANYCTPLSERKWVD